MTGDIELSQPITIQGDNGAAVSVTINMNGKKLTDKTSVGQTTAGCVFIVPSGSALNLSNGTIADVSNITGNNTKYIAGAIVNDGTATLSSVTISGCKGLLGGAIWNAGTLVLFDTKFQDCNAVNGAAIYNDASGSISMGDNNSTTSFYSNKASGDGGIFTYAGSTTTLSGVTITGNQAKIVGGGGINNYGTLTLDGCTITGNTSKHNGGGIWNSGDSKLSMQGANTVTDNNGLNNADNVFLITGIVIAVTGSLEGSTIGISMQNPDVFTSGFGANNDKEPLTYFLNDDSGFKIVASDNEAKLVKDMETGIETMSDVRGQMSDVWYDLNGRRLEMKPATKGVYINNGCKVVIK